MKKHIIASVLLGAFFFAPLVSIAEVIDIDPSGSSSSCLSIENNLKYRMRDTMVNGEVSDLQDFLGAYKYLHVEPSGFFGIVTLGAVKKFQLTNGITPTGYVGPYTRAKIKALSCNSDVSGDVRDPKIVEKPMPVPPVACTALARLCPDGSMMPRSANCEWIPEKCRITSSPPAPTPNTPYNTCRLDALNGMNITQNVYADQQICVATLCDVWGPANLRTAVPTESKCIFKEQEIKRYTVSKTAAVTTTTAGESVALKSVVVGSGSIAVTYDKNFLTCAHLVTSDFSILHTNNYFCGQGGSLTTVKSPSDLSGKVQIGQQVKLCHGNNYGICSGLVTVTAAAIVGIAPPPPTPPTSLIRSDDHIMGNTDADVFLIEYADTQDPFSQRFNATIAQVMNEYSTTGKLAWIYRHFPLAQIHPYAQKGAEGLECANELSGNAAFWKLEEKLLTPTTESITPDKLPALAASIGLDAEKFNACLISGKYASRVQKDFDDGIRMSVYGTPHSIIWNRKTGKQMPLSGALPYANVKTAIDLVFVQAPEVPKVTVPSIIAPPPTPPLTSVAGNTFEADCNYVPWKSSTIYPLQSEVKENAALTYVRGRLGEAYTKNCIAREPAYDDLRYGRIGFLDKRLTKLRDGSQQYPVTFYVDLDSTNNVSTKWMELTGLLPLCAVKPELCSGTFSMQRSFEVAIKNGYPTTTVSVLSYNKDNEWRWGWVFRNFLGDNKVLFVDMITGAGMIK